MYSDFRKNAIVMVSQIEQGLAKPEHFENNLVGLLVGEQYRQEMAC